jgi:hypothetical protein
MPVKIKILLLLKLLFAIEIVYSQRPVPNDISIEPCAIFNDGISKCTIKYNAGVQIPNAISIKFLSDFNIYFTAEGYNSQQTTFPMFDDGTHGDEIANDNIFSIGGIKSTFQMKWLTGIEWVFLELTIDGNKRPINYMWLPIIQNEEFNIRRINSTTLSSDYAVHFFDLTLEDRENTSKVTHQFYDLFPDSYDFIVLYRDRISVSTAYYKAIRNDVKGIGLHIYDNSIQYGSAGKLQGIISVNTEGQRIPFPEFVLMHEFGHRWGAYLNIPSLPLSSGIHWNASSTIAGVMGPCCNNTFIYNGDSTFTHVKYYNNYQFEPLELYTMGVLPIDALDTCNLYIIKDPNIGSIFNDHIPTDSIISPNEFVQVTGDTIAKIYGNRVPDVSNSQKNFRTATVILTERQPAEEEICLWNKILRHYSETYKEEDPKMKYSYNWFGVPSFANYCNGLLSNSFLIYDSVLLSIPNKKSKKNNPFEYSVYPNPAIDIITVEMANWGPYSIDITSINGQLIYSTKMTGDSYQIDISSLRKGVYIMTIRSEDFFTNKKIIKL